MPKHFCIKCSKKIKAREIPFCEICRIAEYQKLKPRKVVEVKEIIK